METVPSKQKGGTSYSQYEVTYKDLEKAKVTGKRLVSFAFPEVFEFFKHVNKDDVVSVTIKKNEKTGFWDWVAAEPGEWNQAQAQMQESQDAKPTPKTYASSAKPVSQYETREERQARQQYIIRQSSISSAIELVGTGAKVPKILEVAQQFSDWVNDRPSGLGQCAKSAVQELIDLKDDLVD